MSRFNNSIKNINYTLNSNNTDNQIIMQDCDLKTLSDTDKKETEFNIQFLGINFKSDDLLIIAILFFLYSEKLNNSFLFIILLLLLFS